MSVTHEKKINIVCMFQVIQLPEQSGEQGVVQIGPGPSGLQPPTTRFLVLKHAKGKEKKQAGENNSQFYSLTGHNIDINYSIIEIGLFTF